MTQSWLDIPISQIKTPTWDTLEVIDLPASKVKLNVIEKYYSESPQAKKIRENFFNVMLKDTKKSLEKSDSVSKYSIEDYESPAKSGINFALFRENDSGKKLVNFDGITTNFASVSDEKDTINIFPIAYSEFLVCRSNYYLDAMEKHTGFILNAGVGINVTVETSDGIYVLTKRGLGTPVYPGSIYTIGGGVLPKNNTVDNIINEITEELGLIPEKDFKEENLIITGIGRDLNYMGGNATRPEIAAYLKLNSDWKDVLYAHKKTFFQTDVEDIVLLPSDKSNFQKIFPVMVSSGKLLSSAELSITYAFMKENPNLAKTLISDLNAYQRSDFHPPKTL